MCTLVVLNECVEGFPLVVAANRDERYDRRSCPPRLQGDIICPLDEEKGGTWMGVGPDGWFVGITNQDDGTHHTSAQSRGKVVKDCLEASCHSGVAKIIAKLDRSQYNPFNLVFGRPGAMMLCRVWEGRALEFEPLAPGIHVISNDCWGHLYDTKVERAFNVASRIDSRVSIREASSALFQCLGAHCESVNDPFQSLCVHAEEHAFGTRSSSIITVSNEMEAEYWYSEGHPCQSTGMTLAARLPPRSVADAKESSGCS